MRTRLLPVLLAASLFAGVGIVYGCATLPNVPVAGSDLTDQFAKDFYPELKQGMKWTYTTTSNAGSTPTTSETSNEVTKVEDGIATMETKAGDKVSGTSTSSVIVRADMFKNYKSAGAEDVKVPAGDYKGAAKLESKSNTDSLKTFMWLVPGVGMVKSETTMTSNGNTAVATTELKEFKK